MLSVGVTGGIASGKSAVMRCLRHMGGIVFSADEAARAVVGPGSPGLRAVARTFGPQAVAADGAMDRAFVGRRVFAEPAMRRELEAITHPLLLALLRRQMRSAAMDVPQALLVAVEAPLLFEAGMGDWFDIVLCVTAPAQVRVERLADRDGLAPDDAGRRMAAQLPVEEKMARSTAVISNEGSPEQLCKAVRATLLRLRPGLNARLDPGETSPR
ncbi:MAG: dephospho-CoA kinase [Armatimonadetes bacterium]|nr:dephospho-CoA kinase [Armatimonadota bacterium]